ncbi:unnamed protein product [Lampetra planeri]
MRPTQAGWGGRGEGPRESTASRPAERKSFTTSHHFPSPLAPWELYPAMTIACPTPCLCHNLSCMSRDPERDHADYGLAVPHSTHGSLDRCHRLSPRNPGRVCTSVVDVHSVGVTLLL